MNAKLLAVIGSLAAPKGKFNKQFNGHYRSCEDILEALKPLLVKNDLTLQVSDEIILIGDRYYIKATASIFDSEGNSRSASGMAREEDARKPLGLAQLTGLTSSYARKTALSGLFCIDDTKDADSYDNNEPEPAKKEDLATDEQKIHIQEMYDAYNEKWTNETRVWIADFLKKDDSTKKTAEIVIEKIKGLPK